LPLHLVPSAPPLTTAALLLPTLPLVAEWPCGAPTAPAASSSVPIVLLANAPLWPQPPSCNPCCCVTPKPTAQVTPAPPAAAFTSSPPSLLLPRAPNMGSLGNHQIKNSFYTRITFRMTSFLNCFWKTLFLGGLNR